MLYSQYLHMQLVFCFPCLRELCTYHCIAAPPTYQAKQWGFDAEISP